MEVAFELKPFIPFYFKILTVEYYCFEYMNKQVHHDLINHL